MPERVHGEPLLTREEFLGLPLDDLRHELVGTVHLVTPSPVPRHQLLAQRIFAQLLHPVVSAGRGEIFLAPIDVLLSQSDIVVPDLVLVLDRNRSIITEQNLEGTPDLVVEVTSPSTKFRDLGVKRELYERHGVGEYWVVLPDESALLEYRLNEGSYGEPTRQTKRVELRALDGVAVDLSKIW